MGVGKEEDYMKQDRQNRLRFLLEMFVTFLKIGMFTFGGGAMIPMEEEIITKRVDGRGGDNGSICRV